MNPQYMPMQPQYGAPDQGYNAPNSYGQQNPQSYPPPHGTMMPQNYPPSYSNDGGSIERHPGMSPLDNPNQGQSAPPLPGMAPAPNTQFQRFPPPGAPPTMASQAPVSSMGPDKSSHLGGGSVSNGPISSPRGPPMPTPGGMGNPGEGASPGAFSMPPIGNQNAVNQGPVAADQLSTQMSGMSLQNSRQPAPAMNVPGPNAPPSSGPMPGPPQPPMQQPGPQPPPPSGPMPGPPSVSMQGPQPGSMPQPTQTSMPGPMRGAMQYPQQGSMKPPNQGPGAPMGSMQQGPPQSSGQPPQMSGPPPGSMQGPPGTMPGPPPGSMPGPQGSMPGPPQGSMPGPPQGSMQGQPPMGSMQGNPPRPMAQGPMQGAMQGPPQGQMPGPPKGNFPGGYMQSSMMPKQEAPVNGGFQQMPPGNQMPYPGGPSMGQPPQPQMAGPGGYVNGMSGGGLAQPLPQQSYLQNRQMQQPGSMPPPSMGHQMSGPYPTSQQPPQGQQPGMYSGGGQMPPMPHAPMGMQPQPMQPQPQQARRLDPDHMPSPIQVMQEDQRIHSGIFYTDQKGQVPPLVTTKFLTQDQGNASPRFIRATMYSVPATIDMMKQTAVPFGLVISPLARQAVEEPPPPVVDMGELGPVRCIRCKAYMCPYMQFMDGGRRFHCNFCRATTEVPPEYFQHLDHTGNRVDRFERPELILGSYEFVATKDYCRNNVFPQPPAFIFLIDVSYNNIKSGMVQRLCQEMKGILKLLPKEYGAEKSSMKVGFITYNNTVHFYNIKSILAQPQMMVVGDVQDMFMPLLDGFLCDPEESAHVIDSLMEQIPAMFAETRETETVLAPAIQAGLEALKAAECNGKLLVFHSSLPIAEAPGKLKNRDDRKVLGTEKEKSVLGPQNNYYNNLGQDCVMAGCSVDLFIFNNSYIDLATIGQVSRLTGGEIFKYTYFQADLDGERLIADIKRDIERTVAFDTVMRVRTSTGVRATDFFGHFFMANTTDMEIASIDCDKGVAVEIKHDDKLTEEDGVYVQVALLYTSCGGQRRLRILNLSLKICTQMADLYRSCDLDTMINFFSKQSVFKLLEGTPKTVKDGLVARCAQILACYRKNCATASSSGQLILPECMKLLPLYANCLMKSDAISGGSDLTIDDRSFVMQAVMTMDVPSSVVYFYPRLIPLHDLISDPDGKELPQPMRCLAEKMRDDGVYVLENGIHMFLWIGLNVGVQWVRDVFGAQSAAQIDIDRTSLPEIDNPLSERIRAVIEEIRQQRHRRMRLTLVRQRDKLEIVFKHFLVEDRGNDGSPSYVDFLCQMHKEIRELLR
ncbi:protein transport protein Sec24C isoform X2 [Ischnura elegans]|uniref:protein transport protein Sec24C isoform X2 n=1 Tax=Ischnura elegans TaxID=197161 RepID=UPI001ED87D12|nr:protein transport protein Sec24C isoform X2 [Ischnura elegans]